MTPSAQWPGGIADALPETAELDGGRLAALGGLRIEALAEQFGTPLWLLDRATLLGRMRAYREAFSDASVVYAAKALCILGVLQLVDDEGLHLDCASGGELATAEAAGFPMERVVLHGNNKSLAELRDAARLGVGRIVVDSFAELRRLEQVAREARRTLDVQLRVTPGVDAHTHEFVATGHDDSKFGFTLSKGLAHRAAAQAVGSEGVALRGVHCHVGSQVFALEAFTAAAEAMVGFVADVQDRHGVAVDELNLGGGLGVVEDPGDQPPSVGRYAEVVREAVAGAAGRRGVAVPRLLVEPGRSIVGPAGVTVYRVGTIKDLPGLRTYLAVDGGLSDNPRYALYGATHPFLPAGDRPADGDARPVTVVGKHCESGDVLGEGVWLPSGLGEDGLLAAAGTGAYHHSMASNYNRLGRPPVVLVGDGQATVLSRRETAEDLLAREASLR